MEVATTLTIKELKKLILTTKKESADVSKSYAAILKQVEAATIGVKNPETDETKLIVSAAKKELKEQEQSKAAGAPYNAVTMELCSSIISAMSPKLMSENETRQAIADSLSSIDSPNMGKVMGFMKNKYSNLDMALLSKIVKEMQF